MNHIQLKIFTQPINETSEEEGKTFKLSFQESEPGPPHKVIFTTYGICCENHLNGSCNRYILW